jgi:hypothetical protein
LKVRILTILLLMLQRLMELILNWKRNMCYSAVTRTMTESPQVTLSGTVRW